jgi:hypothetical protein
MSTAATIINRAQRQLQSGAVEERNKLSATISASATTLGTTYDLGGLRSGTVFEIDSELFYVWEAAVSSKTLTIERGFAGTTPATHTAGAIITISPRFPRSQILEAVNNELVDLSSPMNGLFRIKTIDLEYNGYDSIINLPIFDGIIDLVEARLRYTSSDHPIIRKVQLVRDLPTVDFPSGYGLKFNQQCRSGDIRVTYKAPYGSVTTEADNLQVVAGISAEAEDILVVGAQIRLMAPREIRRNFIDSQGDTRRSDEVQAGAIANSVTNLLRLRRDRVQAEAARLARLYPVFLSRD